MHAMIQSTSNSGALKNLLKNALTDQIDSREMFFA